MKGRNALGFSTDDGSRENRSRVGCNFYLDLERELLKGDRMSRRQDLKKTVDRYFPRRLFLMWWG